MSNGKWQLSLSTETISLPLAGFGLLAGVFFMIYLEHENKHFYRIWIYHHRHSIRNNPCVCFAVYQKYHFSTSL